MKAYGFPVPITGLTRAGWITTHEPGGVERDSSLPTGRGSTFSFKKFRDRESFCLQSRNKLLKRVGASSGSLPRDQPIPMAVPIALEGSEQLGHFVFGQMLTDAVDFVGIPPDLALIA